MMDSTSQNCREGHEHHLCHLFNLNLLQSDPEEYMALTRDARFICIGCGRVAASSENLCAPRPLYPAEH